MKVDATVVVTQNLTYFSACVSHAHCSKLAHSDPMPVALVLGADPGTIVAAVTPVPDTLSEYQFAGLLRSKAVELVDCKTIPLRDNRRPLEAVGKGMPNLYAFHNRPC